MNWLKSKWRRFKYYLIGLLIIPSSLATLGAINSIKVNSALNEIESLQANYLSSNGKYAGYNTKKNDLGTFDNKTKYDIQVIEYKTPKAEVGFQVILRNGDYVKHIGYGPEAGGRTADWTYAPFSIAL